MLIIAGGYFIARLLVKRHSEADRRRTKTKLDDEIFAEVDNELRWLVVLLIADFAISGLSFLGDTLRTRINDLFFLLNLIILTSMILGLIRFAANQYKATLETPEDPEAPRSRHSFRSALRLLPRTDLA